MSRKLLQLGGLNAILLSVFLTFFLQAQAQTIRCGTVDAELQRYLDNPDLETYEEFEAWLAKKIEDKNVQAQTGLVINGVYQIPVIVHVIHNGEAIGSGTNISAAVVQSQIDVLNEDFRRILGTNGYNTHPDGADTQIEFCLARRKPDGTGFAAGDDGINRVNRNTAGFTAPPYATAYINSTIKPYTTVTQGYSPSNYMNFWCMNLGSGLLGYAQFPTTILGGMSCGTQSTSTDGVVMLYSSVGKSSVTGNTGVYNEGRTATHEIGHWLGLRHIWGDGGCGVDDYCLDTPISDAANYGCQTGSISCSSVDMVENYMDYSDDLCMNIFTNDQRMRMRTVLENSPIRASLITSDACIPPAVSDASIVNIINPVGDNCVGPIIPVVSLRNRGATTLTSSTISYTIDGGTATNFSWTGSLAPGATLNVTLPSFTAPLGNHVFNAVNSLPNGVIDPNTIYDASEITFAVSTGIQPNFSENFDGGTFPPNVRWNIDNPNSDCYEWVGATAVSSAGVTNNACAIMTNFGNSTGQSEYMYTPIFILPCNANTAELRFDVAYRKRTSTSTDRLRVEISTDCGVTWNATSIYDKSGTVLQTLTTTSNSYWIPSAGSDWRNEVISLASFIGASSSSVRFRFRGTNSGSSGGNIYVDNVELVASTPAEINVTAISGDVLDGGFYNFGTQAIGSPVTAVLTVQNTGSTNLVLTPPISITGSSNFTLASSFGTTTVLPNQFTTFSITFTPASAGTFTGNVSFGTNDCDEGVYNFVLSGATTVTPPIAGFTYDPASICAGSTITYTDNSTAATGWNWTFTGGSPASATGVGPHTVTYGTAGTYGASLVATNTFGTNTSSQSNIITVIGGTGTILPVIQGFTAATFPPTSWSIENGGNAVTWERSNTVGTAPTSGNSAFINNFSTNTTDDEDDLNVLPINLTGLVSAQLTFDVAYARYSATYFDQLDVLVSTDCGQTFDVVYSKAGTVLATQADQTAGLTAPTTWRNEIIDLTPYVGEAKVDIKFRNISGYGQYLYIDNINLTGVGGVIANFTATPNPACIGQTVTYTSTSTGASSYNWNFGANATPATASTVGPHSVTYSTSGTKNVSLSINSAASASNQTVTISPTQSAAFTYASPTFCTNATDPSPTITGTTGGTFVSTPVGLSINTTSGLIDVSASTPQTYLIAYTTAGPCPATSTVSLSIVASPAAPVVTVSNNCGNSVLTTSGSNLLWSNSATTSSITVTTAGTYTVTQAIGGCTSSPGSVIAAPVATPSAPTVTVVNNCGNSVLTATGTNLLWSNGATTSSITVTTAGTYTVTRTVSGCISGNGSGVAAPLAVPTAPTVTVVNNCGNSVLTATGTNLLWSNAATTSSITVTTAGTYTVTRTVSGCVSANGSGVAAPLAVPTAPAVTVVNNCGNSVLTATGTNLLWSNSATTSSITVTTAGTYTVTQTSGGCTSSPGSGIAAPASAPAAPTVTVINNCGNSVLTATGSNLLWSNGATTSSITVTTAGTYTVTSSVSSCTSANGSGVAAPLAVPSAPTITVINNCGNSVLTATGTNLLWSNGATTSSITVTTAGTYTVTRTLSGCTSAPASAIAAPLAVPSAPVVSVVNNCGNSVLTTSGSNLLWSNSSTTPSITVTSTGTYTVTQTVGGCISSAGSGIASPLAVPSAPTVSVVNNCGNSVLTATGTNILWSNNATTASITVNNAGTYSVTQSASGCVSPATTTTSNPLVIPSITNAGTTAPSICGASDATVSISGSGTGIVSWTGTSSGSNSMTLPGTVSGLTAGNYTFIYNNGCSSNNLTVNIVDPSAPVTPVVTVQNNCGNSILTATGSNLLWSNGASTPSITVTIAGTYTVTQSDNGCLSAPGNGIAAPNSDPVVSFGNLGTVCQNAAAFTLSTGSPAGGTYSGPGVTANQFDPASVVFGTWTLDYTYVDANGCEGVASATVSVDPCVGIEENHLNLEIYPNPTTGKVKIVSTSIIDSYIVHDNLGRIVFEGQFGLSNEIQIDLSNHANGLYNLTVHSEKEAFRLKIVLEK